jgi:hypothetical protein
MKEFWFDMNKRVKDSRLPIPMKPTNVVEDEEPWCRPCNNPHLESTCKVFRSTVMPIENTPNEGNLDHTDDVNYIGDDFIYALDDRVYSILGEYMFEIKNRSLESDKLQGMFNDVNP